MTTINSFWKPVKSKKIKAVRNYGMPNLNKYPRRTSQENKLIRTNPYGDRDGDGVMNYFDCRPLDKKQQDWKPNENENSVIIQIPVKRLYYKRGVYGHRRSESVKAKTMSVYNKARIIADKKNKDYVKTGVYVSSSDIEKKIWQDLGEKKAKELTRRGFRVKGINVGKYGGAEVRFTRTGERFQKDVKSVMKPSQFSDLGGGHKAKNEKEYVKKLSDTIKSKEPLVEMISLKTYNLKKGESLGEGRHRILAAMKAGLETIPVVVERDYYYSPDEEIQKLKVQEARDKIKRINKSEFQEKLGEQPFPETLQKLPEKKIYEKIKPQKSERIQIQSTPGSKYGSKKPIDIIKAIEEGKKPVGELYEWQVKGIKTNLPYYELKFSKEEIKKYPDADMSSSRIYYSKGNEVAARRVLEINKRGISSVSDDKELGQLFGYSKDEIDKFTKEKLNRISQRIVQRESPTQEYKKVEDVDKSELKRVRKIEKESQREDKQIKKLEKEVEKEARKEKQIMNKENKKAEQAKVAWSKMSEYEKRQVGKVIAKEAEVPEYMHNRFAAEIAKSYS